MAEKKQAAEREYIIPLRRAFMNVPRYKRANKAIKTIKEFLVRHMQVRDRDLKKVKVDKYLNEFVWFRGIKKPPFKVKVKVKREKDIIHVELAELPEKLKFKKAREEKREEKAKQAAEKKKTLLEKAKEGTQAKKEESTETTEEKESLKAEAKEKKEAVKESMKELEKAQAKQAKHQVGGKMKQSTRPVRKALEK